MVFLTDEYEVSSEMRKIRWKDVYEQKQKIPGLPD